MSHTKPAHSRPLMTTLALVAIGITSSAHAFSPLATDDTGTQGKGNNQVELGYVFERSTNLDMELDDRVDMNAYSATIPFTYTYGVTDEIDVSLGLSRQLRSPTGWQNSELGLKWNVYGDQTKGFSAAIKPTILIPVSKNMQSNGLGTARTNWGLAMIGSYLADNYELHANLKYNSNYQSNMPDWEFERNHIWTASVAPVWIINDQWKAGLDLGVQTNPGYNSSYEAFTQLAFSYAPVDNLQIGFGVGTSHALGSEDKSRGLNVTTTLSYQF
ncbi:hypothetical protein DBV39_19055 [Orrella marina]|uniref:Transporter n=2 Tax=Orrella marina TaxID=2163011 RepID=A0A2R4XNW0_9BURK|nr:hypothetical protein DBV39_19055 [Orrella marina]